MPTSVAAAFAAAGLVREGVVRWGVKPSVHGPGVYAIALTAASDDLDVTMDYPPLAKEVFEEWLQVCPQLRLDGRIPSAQQLMERVARFWLADEVILYIGLASSLSSRLNQYYATPIGASKPHSGGYFLKLLSCLPRLWVHYSPTEAFDDAEDAMLRQFTEGVSEASRASLHDSSHPFPFANLEWPKGVRKVHGLRGVRKARGKKGAVRAEQSTPLPVHTEPGSQKSAGEPEKPFRTQTVTDADLQSKQIRIPSATSARTKRLFPHDKARVLVLLRGESLHCSWNPRNGPIRERSGVLRVGDRLRELVEPDEVLTVSRDDQGTIAID